MAGITLVTAGFLIVMSFAFWLGVSVYEGGMASATALLPLPIGVLLGVCGALALKPTLRMHAIHAAMVVAVLAFLAVAGEALFRPGAGAASGVAKTEKALTLLALFCYLVLGIRSFIVARRNRTAAEA